jgi:hypothetical protein
MLKNFKRGFNGDYRMKLTPEPSVKYTGLLLV